MSRSFIFLFDGTDNDPTVATGPQPTNIFKLNYIISEMATAEDGVRSQVTFYLPGIGSKFYVQNWFNRLQQLLLGIGVDSQIMRAYINLVSNFRSEDKIICLGFSRGAIAARMFSRLICDFGILKTSSIQLFENQLDVFGKAMSKNYPDYKSYAEDFRAEMADALHEDSKVDFLGLFDCVAGPYDDEYLNFLDQIDDQLSAHVGGYLHLMSLHDVRDHFVLHRLKAPRENGRELWMPGVHSDIGGGYESDFISEVSLITMAREMQRAAGISMDEGQIEKIKDRIANHSTISINKEGIIARKRDRLELASEGDRIHAIHRFLLKHQVKWKGSTEIYNDRLGETLGQDVRSQRLISEIGLKNE